MQRTNLKAAIVHASRFLARAAELDALAKAANANGNLAYDTPPIPRGAVRRASMDLTRALADLRRPE